MNDKKSTQKQNEEVGTERTSQRPINVVESKLYRLTDERKRLENYHAISENLIDFYKNKDILYTVKLNNESNKVSSDIAIEKFCNKALNIINYYIEQPEWRTEKNTRQRSY